MIERRHSGLTFLANLVCFEMPTHAALDKHSASSGKQTGILIRKPTFVATAIPRFSDSDIARRQTATVWCLIVLLWVLFVAAVFILWHRTG